MRSLNYALLGGYWEFFQLVIEILPISFGDVCESSVGLVAFAFMMVRWSSVIIGRWSDLMVVYQFVKKGGGMGGWRA